MTTPINEIPQIGLQRISTGFLDLDKTLGGGLVPGQVVFFAGEPGVGKSTLVLQLAENFAVSGNRVLYITGEESLGQIRSRADRLKTINPDIFCSEGIDLESIIKSIDATMPKVVVLDSLQMVYSNDLKQPPGSPSQSRYCLNILIKKAKSENRVLIVIGHITKSGLIGGLLTLQHMVDCTLLMTIQDDTTRLLQVKKNRFGGAQTNWTVNMTPEGISSRKTNTGGGIDLLKWIFLSGLGIMALQMLGFFGT